MTNAIVMNNGDNFMPDIQVHIPAQVQYVQHSFYRSLAIDHTEFKLVFLAFGLIDTTIDPFRYTV